MIVQQLISKTDLLMILSLYVTKSIMERTVKFDKNQKYLNSLIIFGNKNQHK